MVVLLGCWHFGICPLKLLKMVLEATEVAGCRLLAPVRQVNEFIIERTGAIGLHVRTGDQFSRDPHVDLPSECLVLLVERLLLPFFRGHLGADGSLNPSGKVQAVVILPLISTHVNVPVWGL